MRSLVVVVGLLLISVGCSGDGGGGDAGGPLTKAEYVEAANVICNDMFYELASVAPDAEAPSPFASDEEVATFLKEAAPNIADQVAIWRAALEEIRSLQAPAGDEVIVEEFVGSLQVVVEPGEEAVELAEQGDVAGWAEINAEMSLYTPAVEEFLRYGLDDCFPEAELYLAEEVQAFRAALDIPQGMAFVAAVDGGYIEDSSVLRPDRPDNALESLGDRPGFVATTDIPAGTVLTEDMFGPG